MVLQQIHPRPDVAALFTVIYDMITGEAQNRETVFVLSCLVLSVVTCAGECERRLRLVARDFICGASGFSCSILAHR